MTKKEAIELARQTGWTKADAERAFSNFTGDISKKDFYIALTEFAGSELKQRQRLQASQKSEVTKKNKQIKKIELDHAAKIEDYQNDLSKEREFWRKLLSGVYSKSKEEWGFSNPLIEKILSEDNAA